MYFVQRRRYRGDVCLSGRKSVEPTLRAVPSCSTVTSSSFMPRSLAMYSEPVTMAMSCSRAFRRSPKPGALIAHTLMIPRSLFTTSVASASPAHSHSSLSGTGSVYSNTIHFCNLPKPHVMFQDTTPAWEATGGVGKQKHGGFWWINSSSRLWRLAVVLLPHQIPQTCPAYT